MTKSIEINGLKIGTGMPKICVPITGTSIEEIVTQAKAIAAKNPDLVEWRADFFEELSDPNKSDMAVAAITKEIATTPLIFTYRTKGEGGNGGITKTDYLKLIEMVTRNSKVPLIDVELFTADDKCEEIMEIIHSKGKKAIASYHNFTLTPPKDKIIEVLKKMDSRGADILKVAVMPKVKADVDILLETTAEMSKVTGKPLITMSMAKLGSPSRVWGEKYGSAVTFALVGEGTAPGQLEFDELKRLLVEVHDELVK